jgi:hypothetical protein
VVKPAARGPPQGEIRQILPSLLAATTRGPRKTGLDMPPSAACDESSVDGYHSSLLRQERNA